MNFDCLFLILERLNLTELLNVAEINDQFSTLSAATFRNKYSRLQVVVIDDFEFPGESNTNAIGRVFQQFGIFHKKEEKRFYADVSDTTIVLDDYDTILHTFKNFGRVIKRLKLKTSILCSNQIAELMGNLISKYPFDSLVDVEFEETNDKLFTYITKSLESVESVRFEGTFLRAIPDGLPLNKLFPAVRRLELDSLTGDGLGFFNCHMAHLEHFSVDGINQESESCFADVMINNPQIKSVELNDNYPNFVEKLNELLPQLEELTLSDFTPSNGCVRFENVTTFSTTLGYSSPHSLHFPQLQTFYIQFIQERFAEYLSFVNEHNHLNHLNVEHWDLNDSQFQQLTANLPNLMEITLEQKTQSKVLSTKVIVEFLETHNHVMQLNVINLPEVYEIELNEQLKHEWIIKTIDRGLSFKR